MPGDIVLWLYKAHGVNAGFDGPAALQCTASITWLQNGFPESL